MDQHPGEIIFDPQLYLQIFNENISPAECGFIGSEASSDMWENKISTLPQGKGHIVLAGISLVDCF